MLNLLPQDSTPEASVSFSKKLKSFGQNTKSFEQNLLKFLTPTKKLYHDRTFHGHTTRQSVRQKSRALSTTPLPRPAETSISGHWAKRSFNDPRLTTATPLPFSKYSPSFSGNIFPMAISYASAILAASASLCLPKVRSQRRKSQAQTSKKQNQLPSRCRTQSHDESTYF